MPTPRNIIEFGSASAKGIYIQDGSALIINLRNSLQVTGNHDYTVNVKSQGIKKNGDIDYTEYGVRVPFNKFFREDIQFLIPLPEMILQSVVVSVPTIDNAGSNLIVPYGDLYATVGLKFGNLEDPSTPIFIELIGGYIASWVPICYPSKPLEESVGYGRGKFTNATGAVPAVGVKSTFIVPANTRIEICSVAFLYTRAAGVNSFVYLSIQRPLGTEFHRIYANTIQTAGTAILYLFAPYVAPVNVATISEITPMPKEQLTDGDAIEIVADTIQVTDTITKIFLTYEDWLEVRTAPAGGGKPAGVPKGSAQ